MKKNKIIFKAQDEHVAKVRLKPTPAVQHVPQWWRDIPKYSSADNKFRLDPGPSVTIKQCAPMFDGLTSGYMIPLWTDILVSWNNGNPFIKWGPDFKALDVWSYEQSNGVEVPDGFHPSPFKYLHGWVIKTPPGWSTLFMHPVGYQNLPFRSITGIVDTDLLETEINCPFFIKEGFEGVIEKGTPMVQLLPFKRDNWEAEYDQFEENEHYFNGEKLRTKLYGYYHSLREKKHYR